MKRVMVKICGITRGEDLATVAAAGADAVGFVIGVASSPRNLTMEKAKKIMERAPTSIDKVVVTVPNSIDFLVKIYEKLKPDAIQIHGESLSESSLFRERLPGVRLIKAVHVKSNNVVTAAVQASKFFDAVLLDSFVKGKFGGTGVVHDWELSKIVKEAIFPKPLILAGGLSPENVREAIRFVQPYGVDVSTGVESRPGIKDPEKVLAFVKACEGY